MYSSDVLRADGPYLTFVTLFLSDQRRLDSRNLGIFVEIEKTVTGMM